jgi:AcrR family transcriptional regulator
VASDLKHRLIAAAQECIAEVGIANTTTRKVAERVGVSHGTIAYYFKNRKGLLDAAMIDLATSYVDRLYSLEDETQYGPPGPEALDKLVDSWIERNRAGPGFVVQMIDAGLHDMELRDVHNRFVLYGSRLIESFIQAGIEAGHYRADISPHLAAKLIHGVLVWWGSELGGAAVSRDLASDLVRLAVQLLRPEDTEGAETVVGRFDGESTMNIVRSSFLADPRLNREAASALGDAVETMYLIAADRQPADRALKVEASD